MSISISNTYAASPASTVQNVPKAATPVAKETSIPTDTVKLSQTAQIHARKQQSGQGVSAIASALGVSLASVDSILGIALTPAAATPTTSATATISLPVAVKG
jgi:hypothetical protein